MRGGEDIGLPIADKSIHHEGQEIQSSAYRNTCRDQY